MNLNVSAQVTQNGKMKFVIILILNSVTPNKSGKQYLEGRKDVKAC